MKSPILKTDWMMSAKRNTWRRKGGVALIAGPYGNTEEYGLCNEGGIIRPIRIRVRLAWPVAALRELLACHEGGTK